MGNKKELLRAKRHRRILLRLRGTAQRPRLIVRRSLKNLYLQIRDDVNNKTLLSLSTMDEEIKQKFPYGGNVKAAAFLGDVAARRIKEKGIAGVVFDRAGYIYHGKVKAFAEGLKKGGIRL